MMAWRLALLTSLAMLALLPGSLGRAQASGRGGDAEPRVAAQSQVTFPFQLVLSGPATAAPGGELTYVLDYRLVLPRNDAGATIVFDYSQHATLESAQATAGPQPSVVTQAPGVSVRVQLPADSGRLAFVVRLAAGFAGPITVGVEVPGTGITFPPSSVTSLTTSVTPGSNAQSSATALSAAASLPGTGSGRQTGLSWPLWASTAALALAALVTLAGAYARRGQRR